MQAQLIALAMLCGADDGGFTVEPGYTVETVAFRPEEQADKFTVIVKKDEERPASNKWQNLPVEAAMAKAKDAGKPLVIFHGQDRKPVKGCVTSQVDDYAPHVRLYDAKGRLKNMLLGKPSAEAIEERVGEFSERPRKTTRKVSQSRPVRVQQFSRGFMAGPMTGGGSCGPGG